MQLIPPLGLVGRTGMAPSHLPEVAGWQWRHLWGAKMHRYGITQSTCSVLQSRGHKLRVQGLRGWQRRAGNRVKAIPHLSQAWVAEAWAAVQAAGWGRRAVAAAQ